MHKIWYRQLRREHANRKATAYFEARKPRTQAESTSELMAMLHNQGKAIQELASAVKELKTQAGPSLPPGGVSQAVHTNGTTGMLLLACPSLADVFCRDAICMQWGVWCTC